MLMLVQVQKSFDQAWIYALTLSDGSIRPCEY